MRKENFREMLFILFPAISKFSDTVFRFFPLVSTEEEMKEEHRLVTKVTTPVSLSKKLPDFGNWT
jgi:hypothetical protein